MATGFRGKGHGDSAGGFELAGAVPLLPGMPRMGKPPGGAADEEFMEDRLTARWGRDDAGGQESGFRGKLEDISLNQ